MFIVSSRHLSRSVITKSSGGLKRVRVIPNSDGIESSFDQRRFSTTKEAVVKPEVEPQYYVARSERTRPNQVFQLSKSDPLRFAKAYRTQASKEINYTPEHWARHKDPWRKFRHLKSVFSSSTFQRLLIPDMLFLTAVSSGVCSYNYFYAADVASQLHFDGSAMAGATTAIGLMAGFRINSCYGRYDEGRKFWGEINNSSRDLAGNALMWLSNEEQKDRMLKLIKAFPVAMNFHLNHKGGHHFLNNKDDPDFNAKKYAEYYAEMKDIYQDETHDDFVKFCNTYHSGGHVPLAITSAMRKVIAGNMAEGDPMYNREMDEQVQRLVACMGQCERVLRTPIPTSFNRHISRLFFAWSNSLPFVMYGALGPVGTVPASLLASYAVLGMADIGVQLEEPFNILPMRQYSDGIYDGINSIESGYLAARQNLVASSGSGLAHSSAFNPASIVVPDAPELQDEDQDQYEWDSEEDERLVG